MSSVQFNLLPDVKLEYVKAQRMQNLIVSVSILVAAVSFGLFILTLFTADVVQKKQLSDSAKDLKSYTSELKAKPNVEKIVTVQNQLASLVPLHQSKHITSRLFTYLPALTPTTVQISDLSLDHSTNTAQITGSSDSQQSINTFIDSLKFTTVKVGSSNESKKAFSNVLETEFSIDTAGKGANFTITAQYDPDLFSNNLNGQQPALTVPKLTSTRSVIEDPANLLFNGSIAPPKEKKGS